MPAQVPEKARQIMPSIPDNYPQNYADCERMGSCRLGNNTRLVSTEAGWAVVLHNTAVVTFRPDGRVILDTGGWNTPTTRLRFRACGFNFSRKDVDSWPGTRVQFNALSYPDAPGYAESEYDAAWSSFLESLEPV